MSYSHAADSRLAPALQRGLERLTRAWYQRQALRIFRDQTNLSATADLSATIERALRNSRHFLLLASPGAAQSPWVRREIRFWKVNRGREKLLIALTDGVIKWDDEAGDFDWEVTNALPEEELRGWFASEPLWVNLGWTHDRKPSDLTLRHGRFRGDVATLAASLHGRSKEQIDSEDARQHRRAVWIGRAVVAALAVLLVLSGVETNSANTQRGIAQQQRNVAQQQQKLAQEQTVIAQQQRKLATQRALEAEAQEEAATAPVTSLDMSLAALRIDPTPQITQTLLNTLLHTRYLGTSQPQTPNATANAAAFSPDGQQFANAYTDESGNTVVSLWNTANPERVSRVANLPGIGGGTQITDVTFSPDGRLLAVVANGQVQLWSATAKPRRISSLSLPAAQAVAFAPNGKTLAAVAGKSTNGTLETWNLADAAAPRLLGRVGGVYYPQSAAFSPDGQILVTGSGVITGSNNGTITGRTRTVVWDVSAPQAPRQLTTIQVWDGEGGFAFAPDGRTLAITWSNEVSLWDITDPAQPRELSELAGDTDEIESIAFSQDGQTLATGGLDDKVLLWDTTDPAHIPNSTLLVQDTTAISAVAFVPGGQSLLVADWNTRVSQWSAAGNAPTLAATLTDPDDLGDIVNAVAVSPNSRVLAAAYNNHALILWNLADPAHPTELARITTSAGPVSAVAFSPDSSVLAVGSWVHQVSLWDVRDPASPRVLATIAVPGGATTWLAFTPSGTTLAGGGDQYVDGIPSGLYLAWSALWDTSNPNRPVVQARFSNVASDEPGTISPDGKILMLPGAQPWDIANPAHPVALRSSGDLSSDGDNLTFAPVRGLAATNSEENQVLLWSYDGQGTARELSTVTSLGTALDDDINSLSFNPSGNLLAVASDNFTTTVWDIADTTRPFPAQTASDAGTVNDAVFSPDDRLLVTASNDGTTKVWELNGLPAIAANPVGLACQLTGGGFTRAQWAQYVPGIPYAASCP